jgi:hypothetical protein
MKIKLDENIGRRGLELLRLAGHDVMTVRDQNLQGFVVLARERSPKGALWIVEPGRVRVHLRGED